MINLKQDIDLSNYTLILPSVAVGNVGQLSIDLLISSLSLQKVGNVINSSFIPIVGPDPYNNNSEDNCTAIDIYINSDAKIIVLQIRSLLTKKPTSLFEELTNFVKEKNIAKVIILSSSYDYEKRDAEIRTTPLRYLASEKALSLYGTLFESNTWLEFEKKVVDYMEVKDGFQIPGGGFAKDLFDTLQSEDIPCIILLKFCSEGDNIPDALDLINYFNQLMPVMTKENGNLKVTYPSSWKFLFGNEPPLEIY